MTKTQIEHLRLLGYQDTQEEGAILEHPHLSKEFCYIWNDDKFVEVMELFPCRLSSAIRKRIAYDVTHYRGNI